MVVDTLGATGAAWLAPVPPAGGGCAECGVCCAFREACTELASSPCTGVAFSGAAGFTGGINEAPVISG
jgi:hypothetical protein